MFEVLTCIATEHDQAMVVMAALIWIIGSVAFLLTLNRHDQASADRKSVWLAASATAAGIGVWATHFVAMLAYDGGLPISFDPILTTLSVLIAVGAFWVALKARASS